MALITLKKQRVRKPLNPIQDDVYLKNALHAWLFRNARDLTDLGSGLIDLTQSGTITWSPSLKGLGRTFGGTSSDYFTTGNVSAPSEWMFEMLFQLNSTSEQLIITMAESPNSGTADRRIYVDAAGDIGAQLYDGADKESSWGSAVAGKFYHVIAGTDGNLLHCTINGVSGNIQGVNNGGYAGYVTPEWVMGSGRAFGAPGNQQPSDATVLAVIIHNKYITPSVARAITSRLHQFDMYGKQEMIVPVVAVGGNTVTSNQTEEGDSQLALIDVITQVTSNQTEVGDSQLALIDVITQVTSNQTEEGDSQVASIVGLVTSAITANQTEVGDGQVATIDVITRVTANQTEEGDSQAAVIDVITQVTANQTEVGDSQVASIVGVLTSSVVANQTEVGDSQAAVIDVITQVTSNQTEVGDSQVATVKVTTQITANQTEEGDSQLALITSILTSNVAANQIEEGDSQVASLDVITQVTSNQTEEGDSQLALIDALVQINANQSEEGDGQLAAFVGPFINIAANQIEAGDSQVACIKNAPPPNNVTLIRLTTDFTLVRTTTDFTLISKAC